MYLSNGVLILVLNIFPFITNAGTVIHCCNHGINHVSVTAAENETGVAKHKVNYRIPYREYIHEQGKWDVYIESSLQTGNKDLYDSSLLKINKVLTDVFSLVPAELSAIYFVGGNYYPYDRAQLKKYDPVGYKMVEDLWKYNSHRTKDQRPLNETTNFILRSTPDLASGIEMKITARLTRPGVFRMNLYLPPRMRVNWICLQPR